MKEKKQKIKKKGPKKTKRRGWGAEGKKRLGQTNKKKNNVCCESVGEGWSEY